jgi:heat shock protein HspQ
MRDINKELDDIMNINKIKLGDKVRDKITGYEGIATIRIETLYASNEVTVEQTRVSSEDFMVMEGVVFPEDRLEKVE